MVIALLTRIKVESGRSCPENCMNDCYQICDLQMAPILAAQFLGVSISFGIYIYKLKNRYKFSKTPAWQLMYCHIKLTRAFPFEWFLKGINPEALAVTPPIMIDMTNRRVWRGSPLLYHTWFTVYRKRFVTCLLAMMHQIHLEQWENGALCTRS